MSDHRYSKSNGLQRQVKDFDSKGDVSEAYSALKILYVELKAENKRVRFEKKELKTENEELTRRYDEIIKLINMTGEPLDGIDWKLLSKQKEDLYSIIGNHDNHSITNDQEDAIEGILALLDSIQDYARDVLGIKTVFKTEDETADSGL